MIEATSLPIQPGAPRPADADSRARTHLANERTFLAWLRTGLSLIAVGVAVAGFLPLDLVPEFRYVTVFSVLLVVLGIGMAAYGASRYVRAYREIETGSYRPAITPVIVFSLLVAILGLLAIPVVIHLR